MRVLHEGALEKQVALTISHQDLKDRLTSQLQARGRQIKIDGFRPGKAPLPLLFERLKDQVLREAVRDSIQDTIQGLRQDKALLRPVEYDVKTDLTTITLDQIPDVDIHVSVMYLPDVPDFNWSEIVVPKYVVEPTDAEIDAEVASRAQQTLTSRTLTDKRPAQKGDTMVYTMEYDNGKGYVKKIDGAFQLGSGMLPDEFEAALVGVSEGHVLKERLKVPAQFPDKVLAGQKVTFTITFHEIRETVPFEVGEEFAKNQGSESLAAYRDKVKQDLKSHGEVIGKILARRLASKALMDKMHFDVPAKAIQEMEEMMVNAERGQRKSKGLDENLSPEEITKIRDKATHVVRLDCLVRTVSKRQSLHATEQELFAYVQTMAQREGVSVDQLMQYFHQTPHEMVSIQSTIMERKVMDWICDQATRMDVTIGQTDLKDAFEKEALI